MSRSGCWKRGRPDEFEIVLKGRNEGDTSLSDADDDAYANIERSLSSLADSLSGVRIQSISPYIYSDSRRWPRI